MRLSKQESKYRKKFIAEKHYNKAEQQIFDQAVMDSRWRYKEVYIDMRKGVTYLFMAVIAMRRASKAMATVGYTGYVATEALTRFAEATRRVCKQ